MSLSSIGAAIALVPAVAATGSHRSYLALAVVMGVLVLWRHRENINRLIAGTEPVVGAAKSSGLAH